MCVHMHSVLHEHFRNVSMRAHTQIHAFLAAIALQRLCFVAKHVKSMQHTLACARKTMTRLNNTSTHAMLSCEAMQSQLALKYLLQMLQCSC